MFSLKGRTCVITGAAGLLGRDHALALAEQGADLVLIDQNEDGLASLASRLEDTLETDVLVLSGDVTSEAFMERSLTRTLERFGRVDVLVNDAALNDKVEGRDVAPVRFESASLETWRKTWDVNVTGSFLACRHFGGEMARRRSGSIINIASTYALVGPDQRIYVGPDGVQTMYKSAAYSATKGAIISFTRYLAIYYGSDSVRVNVLVPGGVENGQVDWFVTKYSERTPLGRMAKVEDYRGALVFLASDASSYMSGASLVVDGGFTAW